MRLAGLPVMFCLFCAPLRAAWFEEIGVPQGLSQPTVFSITQDELGYIWLATQAGLNRWDGYRMEVFFADENGPQDNYVTGLYADQKGSVWVGTRSGLDRFDLTTGRFYKIPLPLDGQPEFNRITRDEGTGNLLLASETQGLYAIDPNRGVQQHWATFPSDTEAPATAVFDALRHASGDLWVATEAGISLVDANGSVSGTMQFDDPDLAGSGPFRINRLLATPDGSVWLGTWGQGAVRVTADGHVVERIHFDSAAAESAERNIIKDIVIDDLGSMWLGTWGGGLVEYKIATGETHTDMPSANRDGQLGDDTAHALFLDRAGSLWVGTWIAGARRHPASARRFSIHQPQTMSSDGLSGLSIGEITFDQNQTMWLDANYTLVTYDPIRRQSQTIDYRNEIHAENWLDTVHAGGGRVFATTRFGEINWWWVGDAQRHSITEIAPKAADGFDAILHELLLTSREELWIGSRDAGLFGVDLQTGHIRTFRGGKNPETELLHDRIDALLEDDAGNLWVGTQAGLQLLDPGLGRFVGHWTADGDEGGLPYPTITTLLETRDGTLWAGTQGGGLCRINRLDHRLTFDVVNRRRGLAGDAVGKLLEGEDGGIWASTTAGISRVDPTTLAVINYGPEDGVQSAGFFIGSGAKGPDGRLYFGGPRGLTVVDSGLQVMPSPPPQVQISDIRVQNRQISMRTLGGVHPTYVTALKLTHLDDAVAFEFSAPGVQRPDQIVYGYRVRGLAEKWIETDSDERVARFINLPPGQYDIQFRARAADQPWGPVRSVSTTVTPPLWTSPAAKAAYVVMALGSLILFGVQRLKRQREKEAVHAQTVNTLQQMAYNDGLTRLPNRMQLEMSLERLIGQMGPGDQIAVLFLDLDHFKTINDSLGHDVGDRVLAAIAERIKDSLPNADLIARWGGDEFVVLLQEPSRVALERAADHVIRAIAKPMRIESYEFIISVSIGLARAPHDARDEQSLLRLADAALYRAKQHGRNQWCHYDAQIGKDVASRWELERELRSALANKQLRCVYQPIFDRDGNVITAEALVRWYHPELGAIEPSRFIPVAEETGQILELDRQVLAQVLRDANTLSRQMLPRCRLAVNLSALEFRRDDLAESILETIAEAGVAPSMLELEVTEGIFLSDTDLAHQQINALRRAGLIIAIDDFGTGYSSMNYLRTLTVDRVKIDRSFIEKVDVSAAEKSIVSGILKIAVGLNLNVVAEGVETESQYRTLTDLGCPAMQGYLLQRPMEFSALMDLLCRKVAP